MKSESIQNYTEKFENVPKNVRLVSAMLQHAGYQAYLVGGCVRDHIMNRIPNDYDITTNATPEQIIGLFPRTFYENSYGTVGVVTAPLEEKDQDKIKESIVEVTPFRLESGYSDGRHPDSVEWASKLEEDLSRRDFTCNALAYEITKCELTDLHNGLKDIEDKTLRTVGHPDIRFGEDALRMLRAVRFSAQLGFAIEKVTRESIIKNEKLVQSISHERIRDEFVKILMSKSPKQAFELASKLNVLKYISHEIENGIGISQNQAHSFDVWEHNLRTCQHAADKNWKLELRLAALFHDISKPETRRFSHEKKDYTFYGHEVVGGRVTREILTRLKFPKVTIEYVCSLVRWHMFFSDTEKISLSAIRRLIANIGEKNIWDLMNLRICDRVGTGRPVEDPYRFRKYKSMVQEALEGPTTIKMLKTNGENIMSVTHESPGPRIGLILNALFAEVLERPELNEEMKLSKRAIELSELSQGELKDLAAKGKEGMKEVNMSRVDEIKRTYKVK